MKTFSVLHPAFTLGFAHGNAPTHPYEPRREYTRDERKIYAHGFDAGVDQKIDRDERRANVKPSSLTESTLQ